MSTSPIARHLVAAFIGAALASPGWAAVYGNGSKTSSFDVTMKIVADCTIAANPLDFGQTQGVLSAAVRVNTTLNVTCSNSTPYNIGLSAGTGAGSSATTRYLSGTGANTATVQYNLYQSNGGAQWGNTQGSDTVSGTGNGQAQNLTVYGEIPAQTTPAPDTYKSTVTATVFF